MRVSWRPAELGASHQGGAADGLAGIAAGGVAGI